MNNIIYIVGLIVVVIAVLSFFGLRCVSGEHSIFNTSWRLSRA